MPDLSGRADARRHRGALGRGDSPDGISLATARRRGPYGILRGPAISGFSPRRAATEPYPNRRRQNSEDQRCRRPMPGPGPSVGTATHRARSEDADRAADTKPSGIASVRPSVLQEADDREAGKTVSGA